MNRRGRLVAVCLVLMFLSAGMSYTYISLKAARDRERSQTRLQDLSGAGSDISLPSKEPMHAGVELGAPATVSPSTEIVYKTLYDCGHEETKRIPAPPEMVGLTRDELARDVDTWNIAEFSAVQVVMWQKRPGMSPTCLAAMHVGEKDGRVAVFYGEPERRCRPKSVTRISVADLPPGERKDLAAGIRVPDEEELLRILEALASWTDG